jgi:L-threonylcarbamoyladenylate synthase
MCVLAILESLRLSSICRVMACNGARNLPYVSLTLLYDGCSLPCVLPQIKALFLHLAAAFWPGPLTLISQAAAALPSAVTASTGFVGVRCPDHAVALALLRAARVPVCAPSANRFGHVSPTSAEHVLADLGASPITIIDSSSSSSSSSSGSGSSSSGACAVGIESTVAKLVVSEQQLVVLRKGAVSPQALAAALHSGGFAHWTVRVSEKTGAADDTQEPQEAPGQLLRHYSPDIEAFMVVSASSSSSNGSSAALCPSAVGR